MFRPILMRVVAVGALSFLGGTATAGGLNYSYVDGGYQYTNGDPINVDSVVVDASVGIYEWLALRGGFERGWLDNVPGNEPDLTEFRAGARLHFALMKALDVFGDVQYFNQKLNGDQSETNLGFLDEAGIRFMATKGLELNASYKYIGGDLNEDFGTVGAVLDLNKVIALTARGEFNSDINRFFAGVRLSF